MAGFAGHYYLRYPRLYICCPIDTSMSHRRLLFLINPIAGTKSKENLVQYLHQKTTAAGIAFSFLYSTAGMKPACILEEAVKTKATDMIVCGGDGTVNMAAQALLNTHINLGIIPVGSGNGLARTAGIALKPGNALRSIFKGHTQRTDGFLINGNFSCMLSGLGLDAAVAAAFSKSESRGLYTYTRKSISEFLKASPFPFTIKTDSIQIDSHAFFISIANSNQFGNNFTIAPRASLCDGLLDIVIVKKMWKIKMLYAIIKQLNSGYPVHAENNASENEDIVYLQTSSLTIHNPSFAPLHIDGDPADTNKTLHIKVIPGAFNLIVP